MNQKNDILHQSAAVFMQHGIRSVTLDDLATLLKISKKTFYNYFKNKEDLVVEAMKYYLENDRCCVLEAGKKISNPIDEIIEISKIVIERLKIIHPSIHYDLQKYYPAAWKEFKKHKQEFISDIFLKNMKKGQETGYYRKNFNPEIITKLYINKIEMVFDPSAFPPNEYPFYKVYVQLIVHHIYGVVSEKGYAYLSKKIQTEKLLQE